MAALLTLHGRRLTAFLRRHWPLLLLCVPAAIFLFTNLGGSHFWEDEGDTAVLARNILQHGLPVAWDGVTFVAPDYGQRLTRSLVMISHPWLQYYAAAASFAFFGVTPWAARLPFALAGFLTIVAVYAMAANVFSNRLGAFSAASLLALNVQFLLFSRQARNYSLHALLTCLLVWQFVRLRSRRDAAIFFVIAVLLFHTHPIGVVAVAALGLAAVVHPVFAARRRWFWPAAIAFGLWALPWLAISRRGYQQNLSPLEDAILIVPQVGQIAVEWSSVAPLVGVLVLAAVLCLRRRGPRRPRGARAERQPLLSSDERALTVACAAVAACEALAVALTHSSDAIWVEGLHQVPELIPLTVLMAALLIVKVSGSNRRAWAVLMLVFALTKAARATPWIAWTTPAFAPDQSAVATFHVPTKLIDRLLRTAQMHFITSLGQPNPGVIARISSYLREHAEPRDVVVTNYSWEPLYFHTGLPQGMKVARSFPIYGAARSAQLPDYVFTPLDTRWLVWRRAWPAYFEEQNIPRIVADLRRAGKAARLVAAIPETLYENRANIHFHRFARNAYLFPRPPKLPDALIYHVEPFAEAVVHYREDLRQRPDDVELLTDSGIALVATGSIREAVTIFERAAGVAPDNAGVQRNLANALYDTGDPWRAAIHAERAVVLAPQDPAAHDLLGRALGVQGRLAESARQFEYALRIDPSDADAAEQLAEVRKALAR